MAAGSIQVRPGENGSLRRKKMSIAALHREAQPASPSDSVLPELRRRTDRPPLLEAFPAENRPTLRRAERNCGFLSALRTGGLGFRTLEAIALARGLRALGFTILAPLGLVFEALVGEEHLLAGGEDELLITIRTLQDLVMVFHTLLRGSALVAESVATPDESDCGWDLPG